MNFIPKSDILIISAERPENLIITNLENTFNMKQDLVDLGLSFKGVVGCYKGTTEQSFIITVDVPNTVAKVLELAGMYNQECILRRDAYRNAYLLYPGKELAERIGVFLQVPKDTAIKQDSWTYDPEFDTYYIVT